MAQQPLPTAKSGGKKYKSVYDASIVYLHGFYQTPYMYVLHDCTVNENQTLAELFAAPGTNQPNIMPFILGKTLPDNPSKLNVSDARQSLRTTTLLIDDGPVDISIICRVERGNYCYISIMCQLTC
jgi:hypothetical protein